MQLLKDVEKQGISWPHPDPATPSQLTTVYLTEMMTTVLAPPGAEQPDLEVRFF